MNCDDGVVGRVPDDSNGQVFVRNSIVHPLKRLERWQSYSQRWTALFHNNNNYIKKRTKVELKANPTKTDSRMPGGLTPSFTKWYSCRDADFFPFLLLSKNTHFDISKKFLSAF